MKLDKRVVDMFTELTKPADDVKMEKTCYGTISVVDGTRYVKLDGSDLLVPAASTVKTSHGDRVTVLMKNHSLTVTGNLTAPATDGGGGSSGEAGTAATIEVGTVTTGEAGSSAAVTNSGTTSAAVFDFVIPRGDKGEKGDTGPQGPQGEKGDTGTWDGTIPNHEHTVSDITDLPIFSFNDDSLTATALEAKHGNVLVRMQIQTDVGMARLFKSTDGGNTWNESPLGNADTLDGLHANEIASNPNLLINPDFKINRGGASAWDYGNDLGYCVDCWKINSGSLSDNGILVKGTGYLVQELEGDFKNKSLTLSAMSTGGKIIDISFATGEETWYYNTTDNDLFIEFGHLPQSKSYVSFHPLTNDAAIKYMKLEFGSIATPFVPPNHATELLKIQAMDGTIPADTLDGLHANEIASNPNLLINSWFGNGVINQRGQTIYPAVSGTSNTIDRWKTIDNFDLTVNDGFITLSNGDSSWHKYFNQSIEGLKRFAGQAVTISTKVRYSNGDYYLFGGKHIDYPGSDWQIVSHTIIMPDADELSYIYGGYGVAGSIDIMWIKLELGGIATPFCPPDPATELAKCQRYYQIRSTGNIPAVDLRPSMRTTPTVTQLSDGNYAYNAEL